MKGHKLAWCTDCECEHQMPTKGNPVRHLLNAVADVVGAALVFPKSRRAEADYMANNIATLFEPDSTEEGELIPDTSDVDR
jgi:hypothetical protein